MCVCFAPVVSSPLSSSSCSSHYIVGAKVPCPLRGGTKRRTVCQLPLSSPAYLQYIRDKHMDSEGVDGSIRLTRACGSGTIRFFWGGTFWGGIFWLFLSFSPSTSLSSRPSRPSCRDSRPIRWHPTTSVPDTSSVRRNPTDTHPHRDGTVRAARARTARVRATTDNTATTIPTASGAPGRRRLPDTRDRDPDTRTSTSRCSPRSRRSAARGRRSAALAGRRRRQ